jgi:hypothetical protein
MSRGISISGLPNWTVIPRSYEIPYTDALAHKVSDAQDKLDHGIDVMGRILDASEQKQGLTKNAKLGATRQDKDHQSPAADTVPFKEDGSDLSFEDLPPVTLPDKGPL